MSESTQRALSSNDRHKIRTYRLFTTGMIARLIGCAPRTVTKWFDAGEFEGGYRLPGSHDRRIPREAVEKFLRDKNLKVALELLVGVEQPNLLLACGLPRSVAQRLVEAAAVETGRYGWDLRFEDDVFQIASSLGAQVPPVTVLHESLGRSVVRRIVGRIEEERSKPTHRPHRAVFLYDAQMSQRDPELPLFVTQLPDSADLAPVLADRKLPPVLVSGGAAPPSVPALPFAATGTEG